MNFSRPDITTPIRWLAAAARGDRAPRYFALLLTCALVLSACGDDDDVQMDDAEPTQASASNDASPEASEGGTGTGTAGDSAETRTVEHALGTSEVPTNPQRLVVVDGEGTTVGYLVRLGIYPIAGTTDEDTNAEDEPFAPLGPEAADIQVLDGELVPLESIAALTPDLILLSTGTGDPDVYDQLTSIAPTLAVDVTYRGFDDLYAVAGLFDASSVADEVVASFDAQIDEARAQIGECGTVSIISDRAEGILKSYDPDFYVHTIFAQRLGCQLVPTATELGVDFDFGIADVSAELLASFSGDTLLLFQRPGTPQSIEALRDLNSLDDFLPAVQSGRVGVFNDQDLFGDVTGWQRVLDGMIDVLTE